MTLKLPPVARLDDEQRRAALATDVFCAKLGLISQPERLMTTAGLTRQELAQASGVPLPEIDVTLDPHDGSLTLKTLCAIAHALGKRVTLTIE